MLLVFVDDVMDKDMVSKFVSNDVICDDDVGDNVSDDVGIVGIIYC